MADATAELEILVQIKAAIESLGTLKAEAKKASDATKEINDSAKSLKDGATKAFGALKTAAGLAIGVLAGRAVVGFFKEGVDAAIAQENAMNRLGQALSLTGENSKAALDGFAAFADKMESTTNIADDLILDQLALAKSFGLTNTEAQDLVKAAADLAAATGGDLPSAVQTLGKTYAGVTGKLDEQVTALKGLTKSQLANGDAIKIVAKRYAGSAAKGLDTFAGALKSAENAFGNFQEAVGTAIVESPQLIQLFKEITEAFSGLTDAVGASGLKEVVSTTVNAVSASLIAVSEAGVVIARVLESALKVVNRAFSGILSLASGFAGNFKFVFDAIDKAINGALDGIQLLVDTSGSIQTLFGGDTSKLEDLSGKIDGLRSGLGKLYEDEVIKGIDGVNDKFVDFAVGVEESVDGGIGKLEDFSIGVEESALKIAAGAAKGYEAVTKSAKDEVGKRKLIFSDEAKAAAAALEKELAEAEATAKAFDALRIKARSTAAQREIDEAKKARDAIDQIASNPIVFLIQLNAEEAKKGADAFANGLAKDLNKALASVDVEANISGDTVKGFAAGIAGGINAALNGKDGAKSLISGAAGAFADALIPGLGPAISGIVGKLSEGPEATKAFIREFVAAVPDIVEAIGEAAPALVEALVDSLINEGGAVRIGIAIAKAMYGEGVWKSIGKQIGVEFGSAFNSSNIAQTIVGAFALGAIKLREFPAALNVAINKFQTAGHDIGVTLSDAIKDLPENIRLSFEEAGAGLGSDISTGITDAVSKIGTAISAGFSAIALPEAFKPLTDAITTLSNAVASLATSVGAADPTQSGGIIGEVSQGDFSGLDPTNPENYKKAGKSLGFGLTGDGGDSEAILYLLDRIAFALEQPQKATATVQFNAKTLADIILQLNRNGARLTA